ncbi:hypothetical protein [Thermococcus waiotapuensis]|uniref:Uncharacterized protein n=1 Tax=Thermococcus waiotapuensis TaxID=90909 RepID=A0AAE4T356_9EURY|nr:hypothetical protein [Thermococcus waiotapuensis]MDV3104722.1 hypothetical protein [Thermococcus waiotapuensis]
MIGLVASIVSSAVLKSWIPLVAVIAYALTPRGRKAALFGVSLYFLALIYSPGFDSVYTARGLRELVVLGMTTVLILNDVLQGKIKVKDKRELALLGVLAVSAINDYTLFAALIVVTAYELRESFGKAALYFLSWLAVTGVTLLILRGKLPGTAAEAFVISALGLAAVAAGMIRDTDHAEV